MRIAMAAHVLLLCFLWHCPLSVAQNATILPRRMRHKMSAAINPPTETCGYILTYGHVEVARIDPEMVKPVPEGMYGMPILKGLPPCPQEIRASQIVARHVAINRDNTHNRVLSDNACYQQSTRYRAGVGNIIVWKKPSPAFLSICGSRGWKVYSVPAGVKK